MPTNCGVGRNAGETRTQHRILLQVVVSLVDFNLACAGCCEGTGPVHRALLSNSMEEDAVGRNALEAILRATDETR